MPKYGHWISWNIDIWQSLNSRDSFPRRKFQNRAQTSCRPGPILSLPTVTFQLHMKMAEEIHLEKCDFWNFTRSFTLYRVEVILVPISGRGLPTHQIRSKLEKLFLDVRMDGRTQLSIVYLLGHRRGDELKMENKANGAGTPALQNDK